MREGSPLTLTDIMKQHHFFFFLQICNIAPHPNAIHLGLQPNLFMAN